MQSIARVGGSWIVRFAWSQGRMAAVPEPGLRSFVSVELVVKSMPAAHGVCIPVQNEWGNALGFSIEVVDS